MKEVEFDKIFIKNFKRRIKKNKKLSNQFDQRFKLFRSGATGPPINDHRLSGRQRGLRAFSINSDVRVIYRETADRLIFLDVGTHNQVYK